MFASNLTGNRNGLDTFALVDGLEDTGLTPRIDFKAEVDSSKLMGTLEYIGFKGVEVEWVVERATLALNILGMSSVVEFDFIFVPFKGIFLCNG